MAKIWKDILLPAAIAGAVAAQTLGVDISRASRLHAWFPQAARDTVLQTLSDTTVKSAPDTLKKDSEEDFDLFGEEQDTLPKVFARDTMKVPDSLRLTDPFLYKWYVATRDSYTHKLVVDSLKAEGDSLLWPRIDSLFLADSTLRAKLEFEKKWNSWSKAERKRWTYENVTLPAILHRQDSILRRKDSLRQVKDSIIQNTPRILETAFLPDSLYYKRLVTWKHDRLFMKGCIHIACRTYIH